jgi:sulfite exporter TauE/SafE
MVYSASLYALSSGSALQGGLSMAAFGLGTLAQFAGHGFVCQPIDAACFNMCGSDAALVV